MAVQKAERLIEITATKETRLTLLEKLPWLRCFRLFIRNVKTFVNWNMY